MHETHETAARNAEWGGLKELVQAARNPAPVSGLTHNFYRYPARFSPGFAKAAIHALSEPGDWVMDPFAGGGTTLVEALAAGRNALGVDISSLAAFVCQAKTLIISDRGAVSLRQWSRRLHKIINIHAPGHHFGEHFNAGYYRHINGRGYWRIRKAIEQALASVDRLLSDEARTVARCAVLRTAQWALDGRKTLPTIAQFREELAAQAEAMRLAALEFRERVKEHSSQKLKAICLNRSAAGLDNHVAVARVAPPKLIVTSPPYPGIHVLYHRWQVDGRKEAPAPFWIANKLDGAGSSYYTMGDRKDPELRTYFECLEHNFRSIANICGPETTVVQMVAFSESYWQLHRYLEVMEACGLRELRPWEIDDEGDGRLWREVPNRKWHARQNQHAPGAHEVVLMHSKS